MAGLVSVPIAVIKGLLEVEEEVGDFIANGPDTGLPGHVRDGYRKRCNQFANLPGWARALGEGSRGALGRACAPYYAQQGRTGPSLAAPFTGGQCFTFYRVRGAGSGTATDCNGNFPNTANADTTVILNAVPGPIQGISYRLTQPTNCGFGSYVADIIGADGATYTTGPIISPTYTGNAILNPGGLRVVLERIDGQADNCGDPDPTLNPGPNPPADPGPTPGPEPIDDPSNPTGMPLLPIPDYEDPIGGPTPVVGPDPNEPTLPTSPTGGNPDSQPGGPENVGDPIEVNPGPSGGGGGTDFGTPPPGRAWIGAFLQFSIPDEYSSIPGSSPGNKVVSRTFGNASLVFAGGLSAAHRVNSANMSLFRDHGAVQVTGVYVNCLPGITYTVSPVSVKLEVEEV